MGNSGEWQGYFLYSKTTGSKSYFSVDINFKTTESGAQMFDGHGVENGVEFIFRNAFITGWFDLVLSVQHISSFFLSSISAHLNFSAHLKFSLISNLSLSQISLISNFPYLNFSLISIVFSLCRRNGQIRESLQKPRRVWGAVYPLPW